MSLALSRSDIRFMDVFYKIGAILAIVPCYSFEESRLFNSQFAKIQSTIYIGVFVIGSCFFLHARRQVHESLFTSTQRVLDYINELTLVAVATTVVLKSCHFNRTTWLKLNNAFQTIDKRLGTRDNTASFRKSAKLQLVLWHTGYLICQVLMWWFPVSIGGWTMINTYWITNICSYYYLLIHIICLNIVIAFKQRYKHLNARLVDMNISNEIGDAVSNLREIGVSLRMLSEMVQMFNAIFGWVHILMVCVNGTNILLGVSFTLSSSLDKIKLPIETYSRISVMFSCAVILISTSVMIMSFDFAKRESQKTTHLCYKLQEQLPVDSEERMELLNLAKIASNNVARFTAADFFELNRSTLCTILGTTSTYLIVMIQFNNNNYLG